MKTKIVEIESFAVSGVELKGSVTEIPSLWDKWNDTLSENGIVAEESFGVSIEMIGSELHYLAGVKSELAQSLLETKEILVPGGKFIVGTVEGGPMNIPTAITELCQMPDKKVRNAYTFERYVYYKELDSIDIEIWVPIH